MKYRELHPGIGQAVAERTILRKDEETGHWETWGDVADRVAAGNASLCKRRAERDKEYELLKKHIGNASLLMSGRHLQHGDEDQKTRNMEVFTNCATAASSFAKFYLLLNGSGVGRCYDDDMMLVNWDHAPNIRCVLDEHHPDFDYSAHETVRDAKHKYGEGKDVLWITVPDSREGWAKALEIWENAAFQKVHQNKTLVLDFSKVRPKGSPIGGMQDRPASGPVPLMNAFIKASTLKGAELPRWRQAMYLDHYFAECVLVGGARRSARMSTKTWRDKSVLDFITVKRPIEFYDLSMEEIIEYRCENPTVNGFLWSSNNSVTVDADFWRLVGYKRGDRYFNTEDAKHARRVLRAVTQASYGDGTGEPGLINADKLTHNDEGWDELTNGEFVGSKRYTVSEESELYLSRLAKRAKRKKLNMIVNPCGEIALSILGGYCTIADVVPFHCDDLDEAEEAFRVATRALIRVNTMDCLYRKEVTRTNRIGVGMTGVHEFAWKHFGYTFRDLLDEEKTEDFWMTLARFNRAVRDEAVKYSKRLGVEVPHTVTTIKPAGTTSKLFGLTEGWHLPSMSRYVRWVQFRSDDPLVGLYRLRGYPTRDLVQYEGTTIVGFPTTLTISEIGIPEDRLVTAGDATPQEQYRWLMLGEKYWIDGVDEDGEPIGDEYGNQISYTLKYQPDTVQFEHFKNMLVKYQQQIKCCSVMPQTDASSYEYQPEQAVTKAEYEDILRSIQEEMEEDIGKEHVGCENGACPVDFNQGNK